MTRALPSPYHSRTTSQHQLHQPSWTSAGHAVLPSTTMVLSPHVLCTMYDSDGDKWTMTMIWDYEHSLTLTSNVEPASRGLSASNWISDWP